MKLSQVGEKYRFVIEPNAAENILTSESLVQDLFDAANMITSGSTRYEVSRSVGSKKRAVVNIVDNSQDAIQHEIETQELLRRSRGGNPNGRFTSKRQVRRNKAAAARRRTARDNEIGKRLEQRIKNAESQTQSSRASTRTNAQKRLRNLKAQQNLRSLRTPAWKKRKR